MTRREYWTYIASMSLLGFGVSAVSVGGWRWSTVLAFVPFLVSVAFYVSAHKAGERERRAAGTPAGGRTLGGLHKAVPLILYVFGGVAVAAGLFDSPEERGEWTARRIAAVAGGLLLVNVALVWWASVVPDVAREEGWDLAGLKACGAIALALGALAAVSYVLTDEGAFSYVAVLGIPSGIALLVAADRLRKRRGSSA